MNLWFSGLVLVAGLFLSGLAYSVEECRPLVTPHPTFEPSYGRWIFILGFITSEPHKALFRTTMSQWVDFVPVGDSSSDHKHFYQNIGIRHPTYCKYGSQLVTIHGNSGIADKSNFSCTYHSLPTCEGCLLFHVSGRSKNPLIHIKDPIDDEPQTFAELKQYRAFYLMAKKSEIDNADLTQAFKQASCLGFTGRPDFFYDPVNPLCTNDE